MERYKGASSYENMLTDTVADDITTSGEVIAGQSGPPPDMSTPSEREKVRLWGRSDPAANYDALVQMLQTTGVPPEVMATLQISRLGKSHPELVQAYTQLTQDPDLADRLARIAEYPFRVPLYDQFSPKERVKEAERLTREWERTMGVEMPEDGAYQGMEQG